MPLTYNFGQPGVSVPRVLSRKYRYENLSEVYTVVMDDRSKTTINTRSRVDGAWTYIEKHCAKSKHCNDYFAGLQKRKTLAEILQTVTFTVHQLAPKEGYRDEDLPLANSAATDFALSVIAFLDAKTDEALAATILHELAHYAGATTNTEDKNALDAERALVPCGLKQYFNENAKG